MYVYIYIYVISLEYTQPALETSQNYGQALVFGFSSSESDSNSESEAELSMAADVERFPTAPWPFNDPVLPLTCPKAPGSCRVPTSALRAYHIITSGSHACTIHLLGPMCRMNLIRFSNSTHLIISTPPLSRWPYYPQC